MLALAVYCVFLLGLKQRTTNVYIKESRGVMRTYIRIYSCVQCALIDPHMAGSIYGNGVHNPSTTGRRYRRVVNMAFEDKLRKFLDHFEKLESLNGGEGPDGGYYKEFMVG